MNRSTHISPERDDGNVEYKMKLIDKSDERVEQLATQMRYRTEEGFGESIYVIGVTDFGKLVGVDEDEFTESFNNLSLAARKNNYTMTMVSDKTLYNKKKVYELLVRENNENKYIDIKVAIAGNVDSGKCEKKGTKIKLYSGQVKNIEDIVMNDLLMGDDSSARRVLKTTKGFGQLYSIIPVNGQPLNVNKNHILCFRYSNYNYVYWDKNRNRYGVRYILYQNFIMTPKTEFFPLKLENHQFHNKEMLFYEKDKCAYESANIFLESLKENKDCLHYNDIVELNICQYMDLTQRMKNSLNLYRVPIDYPNKDIDLDPYILGYWLGKGNSSDSSITIIDNNVVDFFENNLGKYGFNLNKGAKNFCYYIESVNECNYFLNYLKKYNILSNKHIPDEYKYTSREVRMKLISGLIDANGKLSGNDCYDFNMELKNEKLCDDMIEVIRSLGFASYKSYITDRTDECDCIKFGIKGEGTEYFPVLMSINKFNRRESSDNVLVTKIKDIKILPDQEYYGFELDGNNRYLHDDFTVTHNSSFLGVLTSGKNDNGRGSARLSVFNYKHEVSSGRTSSIAQHILGFDDKGCVTNYSGIHKKGWPEIVKDSCKIISFYDLCGHEKYLRTTILGLTSSFPDMCFIMIGGNMGITRMTREHIFLCITMGIPFSVVITKTDICKNRQNVLNDTIKSVNKLLKLPGLRRIPYKILNKDDVIICAKNIYSESVVPIFYVSNVTGYGIDYIKMFLNLLGKVPTNINNSKDVEYHIDTTFYVPGVGTVVGGQLLSGNITVGDKLILGPNNGKYEPVQVRSIHCKRIPVQTINYGSYICLGLRKVDRKCIRRGNVLLSLKSKPLSVLEFDADITILKAHSTTIRPGYEPIVHSNTMRQTAKIIKISNKINARESSDKDDFILRTGDKATARFRFRYRPEYLKTGSKLLMAEGRCKIIGIVK